MTCRWERQKIQIRSLFNISLFLTYCWIQILGGLITMKKIITISTLTAGIGISALGINANHADAAEYNHAPQPQGQHHGAQQQGQFMPQGYHHSNQQWNPQFNHHSRGYQQTQFKQQSFNSNTTATSTQSTSSSSNTSETTSSSTTSTSTQTTSSTSGNLYTAGQCTWYVYDRVGGSIGSTCLLYTSDAADE